VLKQLQIFTFHEFIFTGIEMAFTSAKMAFFCLTGFLGLCADAFRTTISSNTGGRLSSNSTQTTFLFLVLSAADTFLWKYFTNAHCTAPEQTSTHRTPCLLTLMQFLCLKK